MTIEQCNLSEDVTLMHDDKQDVAAVGRRHGDLHGAGKDTHQPASRIALGENAGTTRETASLHVRAEVLDRRWRQSSEQRMVAQNLELVGRRCAWAFCARNGHAVSRNRTCRSTMPGTLPPQGPDTPV